MTDDDPSRGDDLPMHPGAAAYEARLIWLEHELPSFEHELRRAEAKSAGRLLADCDLS